MARAFKTMMVAGAAVAMLAAGSAVADRGPGRERDGHRRGLMALQAADLDGDNAVTRAEMRALREAMFAWLDRTGDGVLSIDDRSPIEQRLVANAKAAGLDDFAGRGEGRLMNRLDADGDGRVERAAFLAAPDPVFDALDADGDEVVTPVELDAAAEARDAFRRWWR